MKKLLSQEEAYEILKNHLFLINEVMVNSLQSLNNTLAGADETLSNSVKAQIFHNLASEKAQKKFATTDEVKIIKSHNSLILLFSNQLAARVKKIDKNDLSAKNSSKRSNEIADQTYLLFPNVKDITYVDLGYSADSTWTDFEKLKVVCRLKKDVMWRIPFSEKDIEITIKSNPAQLEINQEQIKIKKRNNG